MSAKKYFSFAIEYFPALWQSLNTWVWLGKMLETKMSISSCKMTHYGNMTKYHDKLALWHHDIVTISMDRQIFCLYSMKLESNVHFAIVHIQTKCLFWKYLTTHILIDHWLRCAEWIKWSCFTRKLCLSPVWVSASALLPCHFTGGKMWTLKMGMLRNTFHFILAYLLTFWLES